MKDGSCRFMENGLGAGGDPKVVKSVETRGRCCGWTFEAVKKLEMVGRSRLEPKLLARLVKEGNGLGLDAAGDGAAGREKEGWKEKLPKGVGLKVEKFWLKRFGKLMLLKLSDASLRPSTFREKSDGHWKS